MKRLILIRHASTSAVRGAAFPVDEPLDRQGVEATMALTGSAGRGVALCGPALRARETAALLGLEAAVDHALDECDFGTWRGRSLADLHAEDPDAVGLWLGHPDAAPHGGETLSEVHQRVDRWLTEQSHGDGRTIAITSGGVIKSAVALALGAPIDATWQIDVTPLCYTELHAHDGRWSVACVNAPLLPVSDKVAARNAEMNAAAGELADGPGPA
ncbi:MAG: histidine phosphatase family protein [Solirubrobacteraceae bacterium]|nr:histidine phosphatase family protein [Patulibacter sp.]